MKASKYPERDILGLSDLSNSKSFPKGKYLLEIPVKQYYYP